DVLHPAEADESRLAEPGRLAEATRELGGCLADQDSGHKRKVGHVAADPELVGEDVLVADDQLAIHVQVHDRRELLHLEPLRVVPANPVPVEDDTRRVDRLGVDQGRWRHPRMSFLTAGRWTIGASSRTPRPRESAARRRPLAWRSPRPVWVGSW